MILGKRVLTDLVVFRIVNSFNERSYWTLSVGRLLSIWHILLLSCRLGGIRGETSGLLPTLGGL